MIIDIHVKTSYIVWMMIDMALMKTDRVLEQTDIALMKTDMALMKTDKVPEQADTILLKFYIVLAKSYIALAKFHIALAKFHMQWTACIKTLIFNDRTLIRTYKAPGLLNRVYPLVHIALNTINKESAHNTIRQEESNKGRKLSCMDIVSYCMALIPSCIVLKGSNIIQEGILMVLVKISTGQAYANL